MIVAMVELRLFTVGRIVSLSTRELGGAAMTRLSLISSVLAAAEPPVGNGEESCRADAIRVLLLLSRSLTERTPGEPKNVLVGANRISAFLGSMNELLSETVGRLFQLVNILYCQKPCAAEAALLTTATPPRVRFVVSAVPALTSE